MICALERAIVAVRDLRAATAGYAALFGRGPSWRGRAPELGVKSAWFELENGALALLAEAGRGELGDRVRDFLAHEGEGLCGVTLGCDALEATMRELSFRAIRLGGAAEEEWQGEDGAEPRLLLTTTVHPGDAGGLFLMLEEAGGAPQGRSLAAAGPAEVHAVDHLVITTAAPEDAIRRYQGGLGLRLALDRTFEERGLRLIFFRFGGVTLELSTLLGLSPGAGGADRFHGLAWRVQDAAAAHSRLLRAGFGLSPVRDGFKPGTRIFTVRDRTCGVPTLILEDPSRTRPGGAPSPPMRAPHP